MTRWPPRRPPAPVEPPAWVRVFDPDGWRDADDDALFASVVLPAGDPQMQSGRDWRAQVRWQVAVNDWYRQHPEADHRLEDLRARRAVRQAERGSGHER